MRRLIEMFLAINTVAFLGAYFGYVPILSGGQLIENTMYATGMLTILPALWLSLLVEGKVAGLSRQLAVDRLVPLAASHRPTLQVEFERLSRFRVWGAILVGLVVGIGFISLYFDWLLEFQWDCIQSFAPPFSGCVTKQIELLDQDAVAERFGQIPFIVNSILFGIVTGNRLVVVVAASLAIQVMLRDAGRITLAQGHPDGFGGLKRMTDLLSYSSALAGVPVGWLVLWLLGLTLSNGEKVAALSWWIKPFLAQLAVASAFWILGTVRPAVTFVRRYWALKDAYSDRVERSVARSVKPGRRLSTDTLEALEYTRAMPDFPVAGFLARFFTIAAALPFFAMAFDLFQSTVDLDLKTLGVVGVVIEAVGTFFGG